MGSRRSTSFEPRFPAVRSPGPENPRDANHRRARTDRAAILRRTRISASMARWTSTFSFARSRPAVVGGECPLAAGLSPRAIRGGNTKKHGTKPRACARSSDLRGDHRPNSWALRYRKRRRLPRAAAAVRLATSEFRKSHAPSTHPPPAMALKQRKWLVAAIKLSIVGLLIWGVHRTVGKAYDDLRQHPLHFDISWLTAAGGLYLLAIFPSALFWRRVFARWGSGSGRSRRFGPTTSAIWESMCLARRWLSCCAGLVRGPGVSRRGGRQRVCRNIDDDGLRLISRRGANHHAISITRPVSASLEQ